MKKKIFALFLLLLIPVLTGCTANVVGKFDEYNEIFTGTIDLDMQGHGIIKVKSEPNNITCKGKGWITFVPISSYFTGRCKGQRGEAALNCDDGRTISADWVCEACTRIKGDGDTNLKENVSFYIVKSRKKFEKILDQYKENVKNNPNLNGGNSQNGIMEGLF
ncbi:hypothetical protein II906_12335 [bacterium]|nr:hypothetical protein [bacterium]